MAKTLAPLLAAAAVLWAQGPRTGRPGSAGLDMTRISVVEGAVSAVEMAFGAQYPSLTVNQTPIKVAPVWYLLDQDFEIASGNTLRISAAPSRAPGDPYLHAVEIANVTTGKSILLRDPAGAPLWSRGRARPAGRAAAGCIDPSTLTELSGIVEKVSAGTGIQQPVLIVRVPGETLVPVKIGPERILLEQDFELQPGQPIKLRAAQAACSNELVAFDLTDPSGRVLVLRNPDGSPAWD